MAVINFNDLGGPVEGQEGQIKRFVSLAGAATSLALVLGVSIWGYRLVERNVNGVPVIKALEGPLRVAPEDPGGQISGNLGLSVNRVAAGDEDQAAPSDTITLAPAPLTLEAQDVAGVAKKAAPAAMAPPAAATTDAAPVATASADDSAGASASGASGSARSAQEIAPQVTPEAGTSIIAAEPDAGTTPNATSQTAQPVAQTAAPEDAQPDPAPGPAIAAIRPQPRPMHIPAASAPVATAARAVAAPAKSSAEAEDAGLAAAIAAATASASASVANAAGTASSVDAASLPAGTRLVQLGAFDDTASAKAAWARLSSRFGDVMAGRSRVVQPAVSGGHKFYRLRAAGFKDDAEARRFCAALLSENAACVPLRLR
ncbi:SPOR domain-containing protein [Thioclava sp. BHET1]|nr:SPOR domain-containing protein [Thioclava sp. BHET1]